MRKCECCEQEKPETEFQYDEKVCEPCCERLLLGSPSSQPDWSQFDFEKGDWR